MNGKSYLLLIISVFVVFPVWISASVVSDNNLSQSDIGNGTLTAGPNTGTENITVTGNRLIAITADVKSTATGIDIAPYYVDGISTNAVVTNANMLLAYTKWNRTYGNAYPLTHHEFKINTPLDATNIYYQLGMGRFDNFGLANYTWLATNLTKWAGAEADGGNLVPNASFEATNVNFWSGGSFVATNSAKHGGYVLDIDSSADQHIGVPVVPGYEITYSFWSSSPDIGSGHQIEYGFSEPADGWATGSGNTVINRYQGNGAQPFTEYSGTIMPTNGQTVFYIGGMANNGHLQFDSVFVAQYGYPPPPKGTYIVIR